MRLDFHNETHRRPGHDLVCELPSRGAGCPQLHQYDLLPCCTLFRLYPVVLPQPGAAVVLGNSWTLFELSKTRFAS
jgi:hypothetical protein